MVLNGQGILVQEMNFYSSGRRIREARKLAGLTQHQLAEQLGMGQATISLIENGMFQEIGIRKYAKLCAILGLTMDVAPFPSLPTLGETIALTRIRQTRAVEATENMIRSAHVTS